MTESINWMIACVSMAFAMLCGYLVLMSSEFRVGQDAVSLAAILWAQTTFILVLPSAFLFLRWTTRRYHRQLVQKYPELFADQALNRMEVE